MQINGENLFLPRLFKINQVRTGTYLQFPGLAKLKLEIFYPKLLVLRNKLFELTGKYANMRRADENITRADIFSFIGNHNDKETGLGFTDEELWAESTALIAAGKLSVIEI